MDRTTQGGEYKGINTAWTEVGQKRKRFSIEDEARRDATRGWPSRSETALLDQHESPSICLIHT
jgi:hypothetical protein